MSQENRVLNLTYASSLTDLCEVNSSFDSGILRIAYAGENRNGSSIDRAVFERCLPTIYNCPIVCHYDRDTDTLGGHDMEVVRDDEGGLRIVNLTTPIGCIPESAKTFWESVEEDDGTVREYLCAEALLWKRQEAYRKVKHDGCTAQSMEITVKDGKSVDGVYRINDFEFTAFALIGVEPCYESASLEFSKQNFKQQFSQMMQELKESFQTITTSEEADDTTHPQCSTEGGKEVLNEKLDLIAKYGMEPDSLGFSLDDISVDELDEKLKTIKAELDAQAFALEGEFRQELARVVESVRIEKEWGECSRYWFVDYDKDASEVYCWDTNDWLLYGFAYQTDGDTVTVDFENGKRKKYAIVDFDEGEQASPLAPLFAALEEKLTGHAELEEKFQKAEGDIATMTTELNELRQFKADADETAAQNERNAVFEKFEDLAGIEAFDELRENASEYSVDVLEEKCFAIRGRNSTVNFSHKQPKTPKLKVPARETENEPYGDLFRKYGIEPE